jgi:hypothetical protein
MASGSGVKEYRKLETHATTDMLKLGGRILAQDLLFSGGITLIIPDVRAEYHKIWSFFDAGSQTSDKLQDGCPSAEVIVGEG